ncbi:hypothetical protein [Massilia sp. TWR1-2-2]|uniref:hypothetical protein n=1 Tax=Massilia sp. TWR1-2-2 TaxID=2804584 RepID=UPI003CEF5CE2
MNHDSRSFEDDLSSLKADVAVVRSNYVTKADLQEVRLELKTEIQDRRLELRTVESKILSRLETDISALRIDNEKLRTEMHAMIAQVQTSLNAQTWRIIGIVSLLVLAVYLLARAGY